MLRLLQLPYGLVGDILQTCRFDDGAYRRLGMRSRLRVRFDRPAEVGAIDCSSDIIVAASFLS
ncbi:MAG: hypothetical protein M0P30_11745 [Syntrophorhabdaceae bacterium]|nr:hypothetical protein [Syntrophorhabdaceae bacterium]